MANTFSPFGFRQYRHIEGNQPTMGFETFRISSSDASIIFTGDPVVSALAAGLGVGTNYGRYVTGSSASGAGGGIGGSSIPVLGVFLGCKYYNPTVGRTVWSPAWPGNQQAAGPDVEAYVCTDRDMLWIAQASTGTNITSSYIGYGIGYNNPGSTSAFANLTTGNSPTSLASSYVTATPTSSYPFVIYDYLGTYSGAAGMPSWDISPTAGALSGFINGLDPTSAGAILIVKPINWSYALGALSGA